MIAALSILVMYGSIAVPLVLLLREVWREEKQRQRRERYREWEEKMFAEEKARSTPPESERL